MDFFDIVFLGIESIWNNSSLFNFFVGWIYPLSFIGIPFLAMASIVAFLVEPKPKRGDPKRGAHIISALVAIAVAVALIIFVLHMAVIAVSGLKI